MQRERVQHKRHLGIVVDVSVWSYGGDTFWVEVRLVGNGELSEKKRFRDKRHAEKCAELLFTSREKSDGRHD